MELTAKTLREIEFRERMRGYHPVDVDRFLEEVATALDGVLDRLARAEAGVGTGPGTDQVSARAAAEALVEAHRAASMIVAAAHDEAKRVIAEAVAQVSTSLEQARAAEASAAALLEALTGIDAVTGEVPVVAADNGSALMVGAVAAASSSASAAAQPLARS